MVQLGLPMAEVPKLLFLNLVQGCPTREVFQHHRRLPIQILLLLRWSHLPRLLHRMLHTRRHFPLLGLQKMKFENQASILHFCLFVRLKTEVMMVRDISQAAPSAEANALSLIVYFLIKH